MHNAVDKSRGELARRRSSGLDHKPSKGGAYLRTALVRRVVEGQIELEKGRQDDTPGPTAVAALAN